MSFLNIPVSDSIHCTIQLAKKRYECNLFDMNSDEHRLLPLEHFVLVDVSYLIFIGGGPDTRVLFAF